MEENFGRGKNLVNHMKYWCLQNKIYHDTHLLCLISFTVLKQQLSSLDAVSFTSCLDSKCPLYPQTNSWKPSKGSEDPLAKVETEGETNKTKTTLVSQEFL